MTKSLLPLIKLVQALQSFEMEIFKKRNYKYSIILGITVLPIAHYPNQYLPFQFEFAITLKVRFYIFFYPLQLKYVNPTFKATDFF